MEITKKKQLGERSKQAPLYLKGQKEDKINVSTSVLLYKNLPNKHFVPGIDDILKYVKNVTQAESQLEEEKILENREHFAVW